jgi:hypothetical protein
MTKKVKVTEIRKEGGQVNTAKGGKKKVIGSAKRDKISPAMRRVINPWSA